LPLCFKEKFKQITNKEDNNKEIDIYELMLLSIKLGIPLSEWKHITFATLSNLIATASEMLNKTKEETASQKDIDMFLE